MYRFIPNNLDKLEEKFNLKREQIITRCQSYLDADFGEEVFDYVIACNTLHHFLCPDKTRIFKSLIKALKKGGMLLISDYYTSEDESMVMMNNYLELIKSGRIDRDKSYHIDIPFSIKREVKILKNIGFCIINTIDDDTNEIIAGKL